MKVREIMSTPVTTLEPDDNLAFAEELMTVERVRHLPVLDGDVLVGILSHRDIVAASESILKKPAADQDLERKRKASVREVMRKSVDTIGLDEDAADAADLMLTEKIGCLPVVDESRRLLGIVTDADFMAMARDALRAGKITRAAKQPVARASARTRTRPSLAKGTAKSAATATATRGAKTIASKKGMATKIVPKVSVKAHARKGAATRKAPTRRSA
ncbi:CBS domain-containing protein [Polyangium mundeleinium]|uniref:CBS domain-containing protein n=1 Tax=Polyangium mundeleinium TaxID=2995306 RepID=A0ABT5F340_9BACT|nr:CBS domain-containing protein [Polyangium mundeleinium]MDC0748517.1 CBS domain-containing protein [Polyangium mundeleinium]